jgi:hypothetical protein
MSNHHYYTTKEVAERYKLNPKSLEAWRAQSKTTGVLIGPQWTNLERVIRYSEQALVEWEKKSKSA